MLVVLLKFAEVGTRAIFVVGTTYLLPLAEAGQFGLVVTLQGLASFAFGYERHTDIQRRMVGAEPALFDRAVSQAMRLFAVNYLWLTPFYIAALILVAHLPVWLTLLAVAIAIAEQLMNQGYQMSMVNRRYLPFLFLAVAKNIGILLGVGLALWQGGGQSGLEIVLITWAGWSVLAMALGGIFWAFIRQSVGHPGPAFAQILTSQIRASKHHFLLGLVAILTLQVDRLVIGTLMPLEQVGVYFRHILMVSMIYQVFNIAFHNRVLPRVFQMARTERLSTLRPIVAREYLRVLGFIAFVIAAGVAVHLMTGGAFAERYALVPAFFAGLLVVSTVRMRADLNGLVLNALHREATIFRLQLTSFALTFPVLVALTWAYGIPGAIAAGALGSLIYLVLTTRTLNRLPEEAFNAR